MNNNQYYEMWGKPYGLTLNNVLDLVRLAETAEQKQIDYHNIDAPECAIEADKAIKAFEDCAKMLGYGTLWPGMFPILVHPERGQIWLP